MKSNCDELISFPWTRFQERNIHRGITIRQLSCEGVKSVCAMEDSVLETRRRVVLDLKGGGVLGGKFDNFPEDVRPRAIFDPVPPYWGWGNPLWKYMHIHWRTRDLAEKQMRITLLVSNHGGRGFLKKFQTKMKAQNLQSFTWCCYMREYSE